MPSLHVLASCLYLFVLTIIAAEDSICRPGSGCFRHPPGCYSDWTCVVTVSWVDTGGETLQFEMIGLSHDNGWIAVGFSKTREMYDNSVMECVLSNDALSIRYSYNEPKNESEPRRNTELTTKDGLSYETGSFQDGRIRCSWLRDRIVESDDRIFPLNQTYHLILGNGDATDTGVKLKHGTTPSSSFSLVDLTENAVVDSSTYAPLIKAHGILMILAWIVFVPSSHFIARYYKKTWPNTYMCGASFWLGLHRMGMLIAATCVITAIILIFVYSGGYIKSNAGTDTGPRAHPVIGLIVLVLIIVNPIMGFLRPGPETTRRIVFNWAHFIVGFLAFVLAVVNIYLGYRMPAASFVPYQLQYVLTAFLFWELFFIIISEVYRSCMASKEDPELIALHSEESKEYGLDSLEEEGSTGRICILLVYLLGPLTFGIVPCIVIGLF